MLNFLFICIYEFFGLVLHCANLVLAPGEYELQHSSCQLFPEYLWQQFPRGCATYLFI